MRRRRCGSTLRALLQDFGRNFIVVVDSGPLGPAVPRFLVLGLLSSSLVHCLVLCSRFNTVVPFLLFAAPVSRPLPGFLSLSPVCLLPAHPGVFYLCSSIRLALSLLAPGFSFLSAPGPTFQPSASCLSLVLVLRPDSAFVSLLPVLSLSLHSAFFYIRCSAFAAYPAFVPSSFVPSTPSPPSPPLSPPVLV